MSISREQAEHTARLARLALTPAELDQLGAELSQILEYMDQLAELDVELSAAPLSSSQQRAELEQLDTPLRADTPRPGLERDQVLAEAPRALGGSFAVPRFVEEP